MKDDLSLNLYIISITYYVIVTLKNQSLTRMREVLVNV